MRKAKTADRQEARNLHKDIVAIKKALAKGAYDIKDEASNYITQYYDGLKDKSAEMQENVTDYVSHKPLKSLSVALLTGVAIGYLIRR